MQDLWFQETRVQAMTARCKRIAQRGRLIVGVERAVAEPDIAIRTAIGGLRAFCALEGPLRLKNLRPLLPTADRFEDPVRDV